MRPRTLAILFAVVLGFGAFIWLYERKLPSSEERAVREKRVLAGVEKKDVLGLAIEGAGPRVRFERVAAGAGKDKDLKDTKDLRDEDKKEDGEPAYGWKLVEPLAARADAAAVNALVEGVLALEKTRTLETVDRKATGLERPEWKVRLKTADGEKVLELGAPVPPGGERIAALAGEKEAYVVNDQLVNDLKKAPGDWRDRKLLPGDREQISRLALTAGGHAVVLAKQGGKLRLASPVADAAQRDKVDDLLFGLASLSADRFVDQPPPPAELGLTPPQAVVEATFPGQPPTRIEIGREIPGAAPPPPPMSTDGAEPPPPPEKSYYLRVGSQVYQGKASSLLAAANRPPAEWQSLALSGFEVHEVESAAVKTPKGKVELTRSDTDWKRGGTLISYMPVSDLLFALNGAKADRLATPEEAKALGARLDQPVFEVTLKGKSGEEVLSFYPGLQGAATAVPARVQGRSAVLLLPPKAYAEISEKWTAVEKAEPLQKGKDKT